MFQNGIGNCPQKDIWKIITIDKLTKPKEISRELGELQNILVSKSKIQLQFFFNRENGEITCISNNNFLEIIKIIPDGLNFSKTANTP